MARAARNIANVGEGSSGAIAPESVLHAIPDPLIVVDREWRIVFANSAAEQFFRTSAHALANHAFDRLIPFGSPALDLVTQARRDGKVVTDHNIEIGSPRFGFHTVTLIAAPLSDRPGEVLLSLQTRAIAQLMDRQLYHRGAARSVVGMAAVLAHEIKNPLSGIRGAAQLFEQTVPPSEKALARLIRDEADRIRGLVDRMEAFGDRRPAPMGPVNIHEVLEHVRALAETGFAKGVRFVERYDPSLPPVLGNRDQLVQIFLNLVKNAAEAAPEVAGEIQLSTSYRHGARLAVSGRGERRHLPLEVGVQDNGTGIPEDIRPHLFDPFVTSKASGSGLGLALVAKLVDDHGGVVEFESQPGRTHFRVRLGVVLEGQEARP
jgi:two-component system nitrogen regulation sensor histidine kinase GlnL